MKEISILLKPEEVEHFTIIRCEKGEGIEIGKKLASLGWKIRISEEIFRNTETICLSKNPEEVLHCTEQCEECRHLDRTSFYTHCSSSHMFKYKKEQKSNSINWDKHKWKYII